MKALRFSSFGDVSAVLHIEEVPTPALAPDEVLVEVHAASINPSDVKNVQGKMKQTTLPRTPGRDLAGIIVAGNKEMIGKQIWAAGGRHWFYPRTEATLNLLPSPRRVSRPKPKSLSMVEAASVGINYITAYLGLIEKGKPKR